MADGPAGFHFDELNKVRVLEPEISQQTQELKEECKEFVDSKSELFINCIFGVKVLLNSICFRDQENARSILALTAAQVDLNARLIVSLFRNWRISKNSRRIYRYGRCFSQGGRKGENEGKISILVLINCL